MRNRGMVMIGVGLCLILVSGCWVTENKYRYALEEADNARVLLDASKDENATLKQQADKLSQDVEHAQAEVVAAKKVASAMSENLTTKEILLREKDAKLAEMQTERAKFFSRAEVILTKLDSAPPATAVTEAAMAPTAPPPAPAAMEDRLALLAAQHGDLSWDADRRCLIVRGFKLDRLSAGGQSGLASAGRILAGCPAGLHVYVDGHADRLPIVRAASRKRFGRSNQALSEARARVVADLLRKSGAPATQLVERAFGSTHPINRGRRSSDIISNRRVEISVGSGVASLRPVQLTVK